MMNGEETDGGISLGDMEKALVCLLMTSMEAPVQAESAGLTQEMFADASLGFVYEVIMKIYATGVRPDMVLVNAECAKRTRSWLPSWAVCRSCCPTC